MKRTPYNSSLIQATSYDHETRTVHVELMHNRGTYEYHDVDPEHYEAMTKADSVGAHFSQHFKPAHGHKAKKIG